MNKVVNKNGKYSIVSEFTLERKLLNPKSLRYEK